MYIDTHCHIYDEMYPPEERDGVIARATEAGVGMMIQADISSKERPEMFDLAQRHPDVLRSMLGLYPGSVGPDWMDEVAELERWHNRSGIVAVGEIGLDYHYGKDSATEQKEALRAQLELAAQWDLPVNIHLREATGDFMDIMRDCRHLHLRGNLHAFSESIETFRELERLGDWYVGIGGVVTFKKAALAQTVINIPLDRIVLETDAPYLTPTPYRGTRNESAYIPLIAAKIAELKGVTTEDVEQITTTNAKTLFNI